MTATSKNATAKPTREIQWAEGPLGGYRGTIDGIEMFFATYSRGSKAFQIATPLRGPKPLAWVADLPAAKAGAVRMLGEHVERITTTRGAIRQITWTERKNGVFLTGSVGGLAMFFIAAPFMSSPEEWRLSTFIPGFPGGNAFTLGAAKAAAAEILRCHAERIGAV